MSAEVNLNNPLAEPRLLRADAARIVEEIVDTELSEFESNDTWGGLPEALAGATLQDIFLGAFSRMSTSA